MDLERERSLIKIKKVLVMEEKEKGIEILKTEEDFERAVIRLEPFIKALEEVDFLYQVFHHKHRWYSERMSEEDMVYLTKTASEALGLDRKGKQFAMIHNQFAVTYVREGGFHLKGYIKNRDLIAKTFQWCLATIEDERRELC